MRYAGALVLIIVPFLFSCLPKKMEAPLVSVPAGPLLSLLEQRHRSFSGLKAVASVELVRRGRKRTLDSVGIVIDGDRRFRMEAYGPLGQSLVALVWDGKEVLLRAPGENKVTRRGPAGLERLIGEGVEPSELCAVLSGNIPKADLSASSVLLCEQGGGLCTLELRQDAGLRRIRVRYRATGQGQELRVLSQELFHNGTLIYRADFDHQQEISHYPVPLLVEIENPEKKAHLTIMYTDLDVNVPISDEAFLLTDEQGPDAGK